MKVRKGFVSNSSTTTFTCGVCKTVESGYDVGLSEAEMYQCSENHTFCRSHTGEMSVEKKFEIIKERDPGCLKDNDITDPSKDMHDAVDDLFDEVIEGGYEFPSLLCPICQLEHVPEDEMVKYLLKKYTQGEDSVMKEIRATFKSYNDFKEFVVKE